MLSFKKYTFTVQGTLLPTVNGHMTFKDLIAVKGI